MSAYLTPAEVVARARDLVARDPALFRLREVGRSRRGEPLWLLSAGQAADAVLVVAGAHANEPVGGHTVLGLAETLTRRPELHRHTAWHFLLCLDPDGARLNEPWSRTPDISLPDYHLGFHRPAFAAQPEWLPPSDAPPLPETAALLALLDELRPRLQCSLHGVDVGGTWAQLTSPVTGFAGQLAESAARSGIPVEHRPFDAFHWTGPGPGVFLMPPPGEPDQFDALPDDTARSTWFHPHPRGTRTAVVEAPMWTDDRVADDRAHPAPAPALKEIAERLRHQAAEVSALLARNPALLRGDDPRVTALTEALAVSPGLADGWAALPVDGPGGSVPAGAVASLDIAGRRLALRAAGLLAQVLPEGTPDRERAASLVRRWCVPYGRGTRRLPVTEAAAHQQRVVVALFEAVAGNALPRGKVPA